MASADNILVKVDGELKTHLLRQVRDSGRFATVSDYVRDLIQRDLDSQAELQDWYDRHLKPGIDANQSEFVAVSAEEVIRRNKRL